MRIETYTILPVFVYRTKFTWNRPQEYGGSANHRMDLELGYHYIIRGLKVHHCNNFCFWNIKKLTIVKSSVHLTHTRSTTMTFSSFLLSNLSPAIIKKCWYLKRGVSGLDNSGNFKSFVQNSEKSQAFSNKILGINCWNSGWFLYICSKSFLRGTHLSESHES